jgi:hypothetical protein
MSTEVQAILDFLYKDQKDQGKFIEIPEGGIGELSDGYYTFNELYHHRAVLFSVICNMFPKRAWKSLQHADGSMFDGMFIVGIETPEGQATYHYDIEPYWDLFKVKELDSAPEWDGHTAPEAINRIASLTPPPLAKISKWVVTGKGLFGNDYACSSCHYPAEEGNLGHRDELTNFCPNCGAKMS